MKALFLSILLGSTVLANTEAPPAAAPTMPSEQEIRSEESGFARLESNPGVEYFADSSYHRYKDGADVVAFVSDGKVFGYQLTYDFTPAPKDLVKSLKSELVRLYPSPRFQVDLLKTFELGDRQEGLSCTFLVFEKQAAGQAKTTYLRNLMQASQP